MEKRAEELLKMYCLRLKMRKGTDCRVWITTASVKNEDGIAKNVSVLHLHTQGGTSFVQDVKDLSPEEIESAYDQLFFRIFTKGCFAENLKLNEQERTP